MMKNLLNYFFIFIFILTTVNASIQNIPYDLIFSYNIYFDVNNPNVSLEGSSNPVSQLGPYNHSGVNWLNTTSCDLTYNATFNTITANWNTQPIYTNLIKYLKNTAPQALGNNILNANLWMKSLVQYKITNSSGSPANIFLDAVSVNTNIKNGAILNITNSGNQLPAAPDFTSQIQNYANNHNMPGTYKITTGVIPIDNKCKFNGISRTVSPVIAKITSINIRDSDSDSVPDAIDKCKNTKWDTGFLGVGHTATTANIYQGCPFEYSKVNSNGLSCSANMGFNKITSTINIGGGLIRLKSFPLNKISPEINKVSGLGSINKVLNQSGNYVKESFNFNPLKFDYHQTGQCNLRKNSITFSAGIDCINGPNHYKLKNGITKRFYKDKHILLKEVNKDYINVTCNSGNWTSSSLTTTPALNTNNSSSLTSKYKKYKYQLPEIKTKSFDHIKKREDGDVEDGDDDKKEKVRCNLDSELCKIQIPGGSIIQINLSKLSNITTGSIKIYNESGLIRTEKVDPILIALQANSLKHFTSAAQILNFVNKSYRLMKKFNIIKNLSYDSISNISTIRISTENFTGGAMIQNLTIYQKISKSISKSYDNISFISDGGGERFAVDKDPIIGWYFNDSTGNVNISYNVSGKNEGGTIILTQEPILFNQGELIINYRQNKTGCNPGEVHLFDLSDIVSSKILNKNAGNYQVCITDLNSNIHLLNGAIGSNILNISSYKLNGNISSNFSQFLNKLQLSVNDNSIYWALKIGETNPSGNFSCLGSYDKKFGSSLFGDCGFKPKNRIWLHLGADYIAPTTTYKIPYLSHSVQVELIATDNIGGSGLNKTSFCIISNSNDCQNLNTFTNYTSPFQVSCLADWSCTRIIKYYSTDLAGNVENLHTENLYLIDKGSACQADCTAKPAPDRYLKECRNLNGCFYAKSNGENGINIGLKVAKACNLKVRGSIVNYNSTHQITCPSGPFKLKQYTNQNVNFKGTNNCKSLIKTPYTIILNGEQLIMSILTCYNY